MTTAYRTAVRRGVDSVGCLVNLAAACSDTRAVDLMVAKLAVAKAAMTDAMRALLMVASTDYLEDGQLASN